LIALWDIRVASSARRTGVGSQPFHAIESWALARNCRELVVETQNTNMAACRFYEQQGCKLKQVTYDAYPCLPGQIRLIWAKRLRLAPARCSVSPHETTRPAGWPPAWRKRWRAGSRPSRSGCNSRVPPAGRWVVRRRRHLAPSSDTDVARVRVQHYITTRRRFQ
jgi:hypothetical protein